MLLLTLLMINLSVDADPVTDTAVVVGVADGVAVGAEVAGGVAAGVEVAEGVAAGAELAEGLSAGAELAEGASAGSDIATAGSDVGWVTDLESTIAGSESEASSIGFAFGGFGADSDGWGWGGRRRMIQGKPVIALDSDYICYTDIEGIVNCGSDEDRTKLQSYDKVCFNVMERLHELGDWIKEHNSEIAQKDLKFATSVTRKLQEKCLDMAEEYVEKLIENVSEPALKAMNAYTIISANQCLAYSELALREDDHEALTLLADVWDHAYGDLGEQNDACGRLVTTVNGDMMSERFPESVAMRETLRLNGEEVHFFEITDHPYGVRMSEIMSAITDNTALIRSLEAPDTTAGMLIAWLGSATTTGIIAAMCNSFKASF